MFEGKKIAVFDADLKDHATGRFLDRHGLTGTPAHLVWSGMMGRCYVPTNAAFVNYGGRGIIVCPRWHTFENFLSDIGQPPLGKQIGRINNDGNYEPVNCKWVTRLENARNKRNTRWMTFRGETLSLAEWAEKLGWSYDALRIRVSQGWSVEKTLTQKPRHVVR